MKVICKYCKKKVEIPFEEHKDKRKRIILKGKCPECGKVNTKYKSKIERELREEPPEAPEEEPSEEPSEEEEEDTLPGEVVSEAIMETSEEIQEKEELQEGTPDAPEEEGEEEGKKKNYPLIAVCVITIVAGVIILCWLLFKKEATHGEEEKSD